LNVVLAELLIHKAIFIIIFSRPFRVFIYKQGSRIMK
jgi:hypothetical protein